MVLDFQHHQHFLDDGWTPEEIHLAVQEYGIRSINRHEASVKLGFAVSSGGIWFPFDSAFGQIRFDAPGDGPRYLSPRKGNAQSTVWLPKGIPLSGLSALTEGWKDAFLATLRGGQPVGAIAGVTHVRQVLPKGAGIPLVFDADGWQNANVMQALIKGGLHLNGKIALIPKAAGDKAGFTEFFNAGYSQQNFDTLLQTAKTPRELLIGWLEDLGKAPLPKHCDTLSQLYRRLWRLAWFVDPDCPELKSRIETFCKSHSRNHGAKLLKPEITMLRSQALKPLWEQDTLQQLEHRKKSAKLGTDSSWQVTHCFGEVVTVSRKGKIELPPAGRLAALMEQHWGQRLKYRLDFSSFYTYKRRQIGQWERVSDREVKELIQRELDAAGAAGEYGQAVVDSTVNLLSQRVTVRDWPKSYGFVPFLNGVLRLSDHAVLPHSPGYGFTWQLPYNYEPGATCEPALDWLKWAVNDDESVVQLIRACLKAIVMGRTDFQRYLELIGPGGTGKGTLIRLIQALLGRSNTVSTSLSRMASSRFETSRFMGKRLIFIPDADYNPSAVDVLKQMTGEDYIPWERKGENPDYADGFTLEGWVVVATNKEVLPSDHTNSLFRRRIPVYLSRVVSEEDRRSLLDFTHDGSLKGELAPYLPGVFNWVMSMPDELMEAYIKTPRQYVRSMGAFQAQSLLQTDNLASWVEEHVVFESDAWTKIGNKTHSHRDCLYSNYVNYCEAASVKPLSLTKFSGALENLLQKQLGLDAGRKRDRNSGAGFRNIRLVKTADINDKEILVEDLPLTITKVLQGNIEDPSKPLSQADLVRFLNLYCDDPGTYASEVSRLSSEQVAFLRQELPELQLGTGEVDRHALH